MEMDRYDSEQHLYAAILKCLIYGVDVESYMCESGAYDLFAKTYPEYEGPLLRMVHAATVIQEVLVNAGHKVIHIGDSEEEYRAATQAQEIDTDSTTGPSGD